MQSIVLKFSKLSNKILKKQATDSNLKQCSCAMCNKSTSETVLVMTGKTLDELCDDMCTKFDIHSVKSISPTIKRSMDKYLEEIQIKCTKPMYLCKSCHHKFVNNK